MTATTATRPAQPDARPHPRERAPHHAPGFRAGKGSLTTGQIADLCEVASRTVCKWIDSGRLRGYRIPGTQDRRVHRDRLVEFLVAGGMPVPPGLLPGGALLVGLPAGELARLLPLVPGAAHAPDLVSAAWLMARVGYGAALIDLSAGRSWALSLARLAAGAAPARLVALACDDEADEPALLAAGFARVLRRPCADAAAVAALLGPDPAA